MKNIIKKSYDEYDFPTMEQPPFAQKRSPLAPAPKVKKKPGPKPKIESAPIVPVPASVVDSQQAIKELVDGVKKFFVKNKKLEIRDVKPRIAGPDGPVVGYIANIILDKNRIGFFEQKGAEDRVFLHFEKGANIPIWHSGMEISKIAEKIKQEIEKHYTKKLAAKLGYRMAIKIAAQERLK
jgi:hypothetical protein